MAGGWVLEFQSLLFWIRLLNRMIDMGYRLVQWFQSLLFWIRLLNCDECAMKRMSPEVSILVVLDSAPQHDAPAGPG